jgi:hypothetical protein
MNYYIVIYIYPIYSYCKYNQQDEYIYRIYKALDCTSRLGPTCMQKGTCECNIEATKLLGLLPRDARSDTPGLVSSASPRLPSL